MKLSIAIAFLCVSDVAAFSVRPVTHAATTQRESSSSSSALFMGRAAAVRAATKSKTDMKKAKTNAAFGKKIIMAVKSGGSPDPQANRGLADIIKQAKANSVPIDVSFHRRTPRVGHECGSKDATILTNFLMNSFARYECCISPQERWRYGQFLDVIHLFCV